MPLTLTRRTVLAGAIAAALPIPAQAAGLSAADIKATEAKFAAIEARIGGRMGVAVLDSGSGTSIGHRADEQFAMCSTFKFLAAAAVLKKVDAGQAKLDQRMPLSASDIIPYAPVAEKHLANGGMTLGEACAAAVEWSDNVAGNLMLRELGGPEGLTTFMRAIGDDKTRLDRNEPTLNTAIPGDPRDTTTPHAVTQSLQKILLGPVLSESSRAQAERWLAGCRTCDTRLRAGLPSGWQIGDKTGTGGNASVNVIGIVRPPQRAPLLVAVYCTGSPKTTKEIEVAHVEVARLVATVF
ncbi:MAG: class A beta-lactamase [Pseudolabrys sp.]|nr:class A beta-lactamase [Pseudolabrys sp.]